MAIPPQKPALPATYLTMLQGRAPAAPRTAQPLPNPNLRERPIAPDPDAKTSPTRGQLLNILV